MIYFFVLGAGQPLDTGGRAPMIRILEVLIEAIRLISQWLLPFLFCYCLFCLRTLSEGEQVLEKRKKNQPARLNFWPFNAYQHKNLKTLVGFKYLKEIKKRFEMLMKKRTPAKEFFGLLWDFAWPIVAALILGLVGIFSFSKIFAPTFSIILVAMQASLLLWWIKEGTNLKQFLLFATAMWIVSIFMDTTVVAMASSWANEKLVSFFVNLPKAMFLGEVGFGAAIVVYQYGNYRKEGWAKALSFLLSIVAVALVVAELFRRG